MLRQKIGYIRVSTLDQSFYRQLDGMDLDHLFTDKASGNDTKHDQLKAMVKFVRTSDCIYIHSMDRLARNLEDLRKISGSLMNEVFLFNL